MTQNNTIQRAPHNKEHPYCMVSMSLINDLELPLFEKGLLIYMLAKPSNWVTHVQQIAKTLDVSDERILKAFKKLIELGYLKREQIKDNGRFSTVKYYFSEEKEFKKFPPQPKNPDTVFPDPEKSALLNTKEEVNTDSKKEGKIQDSANASPVLVAPEVFISLEENVRLTELEYTTLQKQHSPQLIQVAAKILSDWKLDNPSKAKKLKSDYRALLRWAITAAREAQIREEELRQREERVKKVDSQKKVEIKKDEKTKELVKNKITFI